VDWIPLVGFCENGSEPSASTKCGEFGELSDCKLLKNSAPWSQFKLYYITYVFSYLIAYMRVKEVTSGCKNLLTTSDLLLSTNHRNLIHTAGAIFRKIAVLCITLYVWHGQPPARGPNPTCRLFLSGTRKASQFYNTFNS
jgi:hypothetical protein